MMRIVIAIVPALVAAPAAEVGQALTADVAPDDPALLRTRLTVADEDDAGAFHHR